MPCKQSFLAIPTALVLALAVQPSAAAPAKPNVLFVLIDDMGYGDLTCYGNKGDWKLLINEDGTKPQLYDLSKDIAEKQNLATQHPDIVDRLKKMVLAWRQMLPVEHISVKAQGPRVDVIDDAG